MDAKGTVFFIALKESFISIIPYLILSSSVLLMYQIIKLTNFNMFNFDMDKLYLFSISSTLNSLFPFIILISLSHHFSKRLGVCGATTLFLSMSILTTLESVFHSSQESILLISGESKFLVLIIPITTAYLLPLTTQKKYILSNINTQLNTSFKYIAPFIVSYLISVFLYLIILYLTHYAEEFIVVMFDGFDVSHDIKLIIRTIIMHLFWFFGIHGSHLLDLLSSDNYLYDSFIIKNLSYKELYDLFIVFGGSGSGLSLIISIFIAGKDKHSRTIAKLALPFVTFNVNEILIFGLPIVLNRHLLIPFILVPLVNLIIAMNVISFLPISFSDQSVSWITPIFINTYILTDGNLFALGLQFLLVVLGVLIYVPFIRKYSLSQMISHQRNNLINNLDVSISLQKEEGIKANKAQIAIIESNKEVDQIINLLQSNNLFVYYQPKVDIKNIKCTNFEALLRIKTKEGNVVGPYFLEHLELAGLASIIDIWVCNEVKRHLVLWYNNGFKPMISINLHPDTLSDFPSIEKIGFSLKDYNVEFEIIERCLLSGGHAKKSILLLKKLGFKISIDDFGTGYSSLHTLNMLPIDSLKLDKSLIDVIDSEKGHIICKYISRMSKDLGFDCVAEGVETKKQLELINTLDFQYVQGFYFSKAIPVDDVINYIPRCS